MKYPLDALLELCDISAPLRTRKSRSQRIIPPHKEKSLKVDKERFIQFIVMGFASVIALIPAILYTR